MNNNPLVQGDGFLHSIVPSQNKPRRKLTVEVITERLEGRNITLLSYAGGVMKKSSWKCCVCEHEWSAIAGNVLSGKGCPACSGNVRLTIKTITERLEGRNITLLNYAGGVMKKSSWKCCVCEHEWSAIANNVLNGGKGCPACSGNVRLTVEVIAERLEGRDIALLSYGGSASKKSQWKCCTCEYEWSATANNVLNGGSGCPACSGKAPLTVEVIAERLEGRNITLLNYGGSASKKSQWKCCTCEYEWSATANSILSGKGCPACSGNVRLTVEVIAERLEGRNITLLSYAGGVMKKSSWKCCVCEHEWSAIANSILRGSGCPACAGLARLTIETITERLEGRNITLLSYAGGVMKKSSWKCCVCEHEWSAIASNVLNGGSGCPACHKVSQRLTIETITERLEGRNITLLNYGGSAKAKSLWKCCICEYEWSAIASDVLRDSGCPACAGLARLTIETITERLEGRNITLLSYGGSAKAKSLWKCCVCEHEWSVVASNVLRGSGCLACSGKAPLTIKTITERLEGRNITLLNYGGSALKKSQWKCCTCEYEWSAIASSILNGGSGCPACAEYGYKSSLPGTLYAVRSDCGQYVKIGITNNFEQRFSQLRRATPFDVSVIERIECDGQTARQFEKMFHDKFESAGFTGFDGATEWLRWSTELQYWLRLLK